jgi:hypothetical protein
VAVERLGLVARRAALSVTACRPAARCGGTSKDGTATAAGTDPRCERIREHDPLSRSGLRLDLSHTRYLTSNKSRATILKIACKIASVYQGEESSSEAEREAKVGDLLRHPRRGFPQPAS